MLTRVCVVVGMTAAFVVALAAPVVAQTGWGKVECEQIPSPTCDLRAGTNGDQPGDGQPPAGDPDRGDGVPGQSGEPSLPDRITCGYVPVDYVPPESVTSPGPAAASSDEPGGWYVYRCDDSARPVIAGPIWLADEEAPDGSTGPSVVDVAQQAYSQLRLTAPLIGVSPAADQLVHLPTWLWVEPGSWGEVSATASVPGVAVTATATPVSVSWSTGDGGTVTCDGPGTPFTSDDDPAGASPDCGHIYRTSSAGQPGEVFEVTATVRWTVAWSGAGESGGFPGLTTGSVTQVRVAESHGLNTR